MPAPGEFAWRCTKCRRTNTSGITPDEDDARQIIRVRTMCTCGLEHEMRVQVPADLKGRVTVLGRPKPLPK